MLFEKFIKIDLDIDKLILNKWNILFFFYNKLFKKYMIYFFIIDSLIINEHLYEVDLSLHNITIRQLIIMKDWARQSDWMLNDIAYQSCMYSVSWKYLFEHYLKGIEIWKLWYENFIFEWKFICIIS